MSDLREWLTKGYSTSVVDISASIQGQMAASEIVMVFVVSTSFTIPADFIGSEVYAVGVPTLENIISIYKNESTLVGTITFNAGSSTGVFGSSIDTVFSIGDRLSLVNQDVKDATISDIAVTIRGGL